jgi:uncharacterized membrane protein YadS
VVTLSLLTQSPRRGRTAVHKLVPWFIIGFLGLAAARTAGFVPTAALAPIGQVAGLLTVVAMAALGLGVDIRMVAGAGARVCAAVLASLLVLGCISLALIRLVA